MIYFILLLTRYSMAKKERTKIFLDSGDPAETKEMIALLGFLDGQTTNPSLIAKNEALRERLKAEDTVTENTVLNLYKEVVIEIAHQIPDGSVSIEVYADKETPVEDIYSQGQEMFSWISNAHVKFPITKEGLIAAERAVRVGLRVNMTLCFSQEQAAAVYSATMGAQRGQVFISPFVGRLDDRGEDGMSLIKNITQMFEKSDGHVEVLTASVRNLDHFMYALHLDSDIITAPASVLREWAEKKMPSPPDDYVHDAKGLTPIEYKEINLLQDNLDWRNYDIAHELTDAGLQKFADDWNNLVRGK